MPPVIRLRVGDSVVVTNDDAYPHMILGALAPAGETTTITFDLPGAHAFSSGCTANGGKMNSFTSVIVSGRT
jgi:plastocyanin